MTGLRVHSCKNDCTWLAPQIAILVDFSFYSPKIHFCDNSKCKRVYMTGVREHFGIKNAQRIVPIKLFHIIPI